MKRIFLFILTNLAVILILSIVLNLLGIDRVLDAQGIDLDLRSLLGFAAVFGFGGSLISLAMSKWTAKRMTGAEVISSPRNPDEAWLFQTVKHLAEQAGIGMPEVAVYEAPDPNAFATGMRRNSALVAVSTGLLRAMNRDEVEAVLGHEISHVANGDMVTLTLIQGVVNTFVIFLSRVAGYAVDSFLRKNDEASSGPGIGYWISSIVFEILFGVLASIVVMYFSRQREYRADAGAAALMGDRRPIIDALRALGNLQAGQLPKEMAASGIAGGGMMALFSSHPPLESRIAALQSAS